MLAIFRAKHHIGEVLTTHGMDIRHIVHIVLHYLYDVLAQVGVNISPVQSVVLIEVLLRHTENASHGLRREREALYLSENEKHGSTRTVPPQGDGLLEEQHFGEVVLLLYAIEVLLLIAEPHRQFTVGDIDILDGVEIEHHLFLNAVVVFVHFVLVVG